MTLRLKGNHLRIRVARPDLDAFRRDGRAESTTPFDGAATLTCSLVADPDAKRLSADFDGARVRVRVPVALAEEWTTTDRVGFEAEQPTGDGQRLRLLVEKDVGCRHEDDSEHAAKFTDLASRTHE